MRAVAIGVLLVVVVSCGGADARDLALQSAVGLAGTVCRTDIRAGGVAIDDGLVLTAAHVLAGVEGPIEVVTPDGTRVPGTVVGFDPNRDLALISAPAVAAEPAAGGVIEDGATGLIIAIEPDASVRESSFTVGRHITATGDDIYGEGDVSRKALELVADIDPGASGAAAFDDEGHLVGIVFAESRSRGITYAVDISEIEAFLAETDIATRADTGRCR